MNKPFGAPDPPEEIAFLERYGIDKLKLFRAGETARALGVSAESVVLGEGWISEKQFYMALAEEVGARYFDGKLRAAPDTDPEAAILHGYARLAPNSLGCRAVIAPRGPALKIMLETAEGGRLPVALASRQKLAASLRAQFGRKVADRAANALAEQSPALSARTHATVWQMGIAALTIALTIAGVAYAPWALRISLSFLFWTVFSGAVWLRSMAISARSVASEGSSAVSPRLRDDELPVYTVVAALYRESAIVGQLVRSLCALNYPRAKLDIKLVVEADDRETSAALAAMRLPACFDVIVAPPGAPRTKPRALNMALAVARGELLTVYDAEDRPAPDQLRIAASFFADHAEVDCVQAALAIENSDDSWLARMFAVEYAILFDIFNPGLAALRLPIALGGTSNHFRIKSLRRVGGWDAWNVTEDADLGLRLARYRMRIQTLPSDTLEEAPHEFGNWLRQRVRWQKGWMQTLIVHSREPATLYRELGLWGALSAGSLFIGGLSGGLFGTLFFFETLTRLTFALFVAGYSNLWYGDIVTIGLLLWGTQTLVVPTALAMRRRRLAGIGRTLLGMPLYFALISLATWRALIELLLWPHHWHKTDHGREKTRTADIEQSLAGSPQAGGG